MLRIPITSLSASRILLGVLLFFVSFRLSAQVALTSLDGTVTDEQGKRIPLAKVKATNVATGLVRETETGVQGTYALADMATGTFAVEVSKEGFAPFRLRSAKLEVGQPRTLDVTLEVAEHTEHMSVSEADFQLDRVDATVGAPIEQKQVDELPINGRNWSTLTGLIPGAIDKAPATKEPSASPDMDWMTTT